MTSASKAIPVILFSSFLIACGGGSSKSGETAQSPDPEAIALTTISTYADDHNNPIPTIQDYKNAGIIGVTISNLTRINEEVDNLTGQAVDTTIELQTVIAGIEYEQLDFIDNVDNNNGTDNSRTNIVDTTKPIITLLGSVTVILTMNESYKDAGAAASDDTDGNITINIVKTGVVDTTKIGSYSIQYNVKDQAGNQAVEVTRTIVVNPKPNTAPVISGDPKLDVNIYDRYQFQASASDVDDNDLTFTIENKPSWASFDTVTGRLEGTIPESNESTYSNIVISVSDGQVTSSLPSFDINVSSEIDIAHKFGIATQGGSQTYQYYYAPALAIDGDDSTFNHTEGTEEHNWLQVKLPPSTDISKLVIKGRLSNEGRLIGAKVYITQTAYTGTLDDSEHVAILEGNNLEQLTTFVTPRKGNYLLIKASGTNNLHLSSVKVYGSVPLEPKFNPHENNYLIPINTTMETKVTLLNAVDYQDETLSYSIDNTMFAIDNEGNLSVNSTLISGVHDVTITVTDGVNSTSSMLTITVTSSTAIKDVLASGDVINTAITEEELIQATLDELASLRTGDSLITRLYQNEAISYAPGNRTQLIRVEGDVHKIFPILQGNEGETLAAAGTNKNSRFAAFGFAPMEAFEEGRNLAFEPQFNRLLPWLMNAVDSEEIGTKNKVVAVSFTTSDTQDIKSWLAKNYSLWTIKDCNDIGELSSCYADADLIITGWQTDEANATTVRETLESVIEKGTPVMYLHTWYEATNAVAHTIADLFHFSLPYGGNYWSSDAANWTDATSMEVGIFNSKGYDKIDTMFTHFKNKDYGFFWSDCENSSGEKNAQYDDCSKVAGLSEFEEATSVVKSIIDALDSDKEIIFEEENFILQKLLILTADKFRQTITYPMDKVSTDDTIFMKSYFADHAIYKFRKINHAQLDMGNFSRSDFSHITPITKSINTISKKNFLAAGVYALPGQTVKVTRTDSSDLTVKVFINSLRSAATQQYQQGAYNRPKHLQTTHIELIPNETIEITSPYGGAIQLGFTTNDLPVNITFENVGEHAFWASTADDDSFAEKLAAKEFDWAEIATEGFTVHSKLDKMMTSVEDARWGGTAAGLAEAVVKYTSNYPHVLAGFKGEGVDVVPEIHDWADEKGLTIETIDTMKHMNADQASCGYGCSGNPYDAYWSFDPIGHGDIHELAHSLQKMRFEGFPNHAATNTFSYYTKSKYFENTSLENACGGQPFKSLYETIQSSFGNADVTDYLKTNLWDNAGLGEQYLLKIQAMMHAQKLGKLQNGWHVLARVHILEREKTRAKQDWGNRKESIGFSTYTLAEFDAIRNNDWLVVSYSYAAGLDYRNYFDMMGIPFSQKARDQIANFGFTVVPNSLFVSTDGGYCDTDQYGTLFDKPTLAVDGTSVWPE